MDYKDLHISKSSDISKLLSSLTIDQINALNDDMAALSRSVENFPKELDKTIEKKASRLIDIAQELEHNASKIQRETVKIEEHNYSQAKYRDQQSQLKVPEQQGKLQIFAVALIGSLLGAVTGSLLLFLILTKWL